MMTAPGDPIVPIPSYEELSPAFQARSRRGRERLGVNVNSLHAALLHGSAVWAH
jgi:hypothetical protein